MNKNYIALLLFLGLNVATNDLYSSESKTNTMSLKEKTAISLKAAVYCGALLTFITHTNIFTSKDPTSTLLKSTASLIALELINREIDASSNSNCKSINLLLDSSFCIVTVAYCYFTEN